MTVEREGIVLGREMTGITQEGFDQFEFKKEDRFSRGFQRAFPDGLPRYSPKLGKTIFLNITSKNSHVRTLITGSNGSGKTFTAFSIAGQSFFLEKRSWIIIGNSMQHVGNEHPRDEMQQFGIEPRKLQPFGLEPTGIPPDATSIGIHNGAFLKDESRCIENAMKEIYKIPIRFIDGKFFEYLGKTFPHEFTGDPDSFIGRKLNESLTDGKPGWIFLQFEPLFKHALEPVLNEITNFLKENRDEKVGLIIDNIESSPSALSKFMNKNYPNIWIVQVSRHHPSSVSRNLGFGGRMTPWHHVIEQEAIPEPGMAKITVMEDITADAVFHPLVSVAPPLMTVEGLLR
jgi:hypothetical protein